MNYPPKRTRGLCPRLDWLEKATSAGYFAWPTERNLSQLVNSTTSRHYLIEINFRGDRFMATLSCWSTQRLSQSCCGSWSLPCCPELAQSHSWCTMPSTSNGQNKDWKEAIKRATLLIIEKQTESNQEGYQAFARTGAKPFPFTSFVGITPRVTGMVRSPHHSWICSCHTSSVAT